jgi:hypothetical protein
MHNDVIMALFKSIHEQTDRNIDLYYYEGYGALVVPHGYPLHPNYVLLAVPDYIITMGMSVKINSI